MNAPAKYLFDIDFAPTPKAATTISLAEHKTLLGEAETRGYRNGFQAAEAEMKAETARRLAIALEQIARHARHHGAGPAKASKRGSKPKRSMSRTRWRASSRRP